MEVATGITDLAGNALRAAFSSTFTTASPDVTAPRVLSVTPAHGATEVAITTPILVTVNEPLDPATVTQASFMVMAGATPVSGTLRVFNDNTTIQFTPAAPLPFGTLMTLQLTAAITDVFGNALADANGHPLTQPLHFTFTTGTFSITNPEDGREVVERAALLLEARGSAALAIATVVFSVNGQVLPEVAGPPFTVPFTTPEAGTTLTIIAMARNASGGQIAQAQVTVSVVAGLTAQPALLGIPTGAQRTLRLLLSSPPSADVPVELSAVQPGVVSFPTLRVIVPAGQTAVTVPINGVAAGNTTVLGRSTRGTVAAVVSVSEPNTQQALTTLAAVVGTVALAPPSIGQILLPTGSQQTVSIRLLHSPAPTELPVTMTSSNPGVAQVVGNVVIPQGAQTAALTVSTGSAGEAALILRAGTDVRQLTVLVGTPPPGQLPPALAAPVGLAVLPPPSVGQVVLATASQQSLTLRLLRNPATSTVPVTVLSNNPGVAQVLGNVVIPQGAQVATLTLTTAHAGEAVLTLRAGTEVRQLTVIVGTPPPGRLPPALAAPVGATILPAGTAGTLFLDNDGRRDVVVRLLPIPAVTETTVEVSSAQPQLVEVSPAIVRIPAGQQDAVLTVRTGANDGAALVTLRIGTDVRTLQVVVGVPTPEHQPLTSAPVLEVCVRGRPPCP